MYEFLRVQYRLGRLTAEGLERFVQAGRITEAQRAEIIGGDDHV